MTQQNYIPVHIIGVEQVKEKCTTIDGFDEAVMAVLNTAEGWRAMYSRRKMIDVLVTRDGMTVEEAHEYIDDNVLRALPYYKPSPYIIMDDLFDDLHLVNRSKQE